MVPIEFYNKKNQRISRNRIGLESVILKIRVLGMGSQLQMLALALNSPDQSSIVDAVLHLKELGLFIDIALFEFLKKIR